MELWYRVCDTLTALSLRKERLDAIRRIWHGVSPVHCWEGAPVDWDNYGPGATCMRWQHHRGGHVFVPDNEISVRFAPVEAETPR